MIRIIVIVLLLTSCSANKKDMNPWTTIVKQVLWKIFTMIRKTKSRLPSKGGTQKSKIKDKAKGIDPKNMYGR